MVGFCQIYSVLRLRRQTLRRNLNEVQQTEGVYGHRCLCVRQCVSSHIQVQARSITSLAERREIVGAGAVWNCARHIHQSLCRLSNWNVSNHLVAQRVDRGGHLTVLQSDIDPRTIARRPDTMWEAAYRYSGDQLRCRTPAKYFHLVRSADGDISK